MALAWYREADWPRIKAVFPDADKLHDTYAEWSAVAAETMEKLKALGVNAQPVPVDLDAFIAWAGREGKQLDAAARSEYAVVLLRRLVSASPP